MADTRIDELRRRLERDPGSRLFAQLAEELRKGGELTEAIRVAREGLALHASYPSARLTLGRALLDLGDAAGARVELESALRDAPDNILASRLLAQARSEAGDLGGAAEQYRRTLLMAPGDKQLQAALDGVVEKLAGAHGAVPRAAASQTAQSQTAAAGAGGFEPRERDVDHGGSGEVPATLRVYGSQPAAPQAPSPAAAPFVAAPGAITTSAPAPPPLPRTAEAPMSARPTAPAPPEGAHTTDASTRPRSGPPPAPEPQAAAPFPSSTLAELYFQQGLVDRAVDVYRQLLEQEPANEKARRRLVELERRDAPVLDRAARRQALERTIAGLELLLGAVRRR